MDGVVATRGPTLTHLVLLFPNDGEATLEAVLSQTKIRGIVSSPMEDKLLTCSSDADAAYIRCGLELRPANDNAFLVPVEDQGAVSAWLMQNCMVSRCEWAALEHFEFLSAAAMDRTFEVFSDIVGHDPQSLPLKLWPDVFRPNVP